MDCIYVVSAKEKERRVMPIELRLQDGTPSDESESK